MTHKLTPLLLLALLAIGKTAPCQFSAAVTTKSVFPDTLAIPARNIKIAEWKKPLQVKQFLVPAALVAYGFTSINSNRLRYLNNEIKEELWTEKPHKAKHIDNFLPFAPALSVYVLNAAGIKGKNNFRDRSMIYLLSNVITNATVFSVKKFSHQLRPDASDYFSFPSGHTAAAFTAAEFLRQEYKDQSPWYGIAGYAVAATTGYLRMYNNKHWLSDVVAGAGVGIASVKLAYWLYPKISHKLFKDKPVKTVLLPAYQNGAAGLLLVHRF